MAFLNSPLEEVWKATKQKFSGLSDNQTQVSQSDRNRGRSHQMGPTPSSNLLRLNQNPNVRHFSVGSYPPPREKESKSLKKGAKHVSDSGKYKNQSAIGHGYYQNSELLLSPGGLKLDTDSEGSVNNQSSYLWNPQVSMHRDDTDFGSSSSAAFQASGGSSHQTQTSSKGHQQYQYGSGSHPTSPVEKKQKGSKKNESKRTGKKEQHQTNAENDHFAPRQRFRSSSSDRATMRKSESASIERRPSYHRSSSSVESGAGAEDSDEDWMEQAEKVKMKFMSMWNNVKYGWTVKTTKTQFSLQKAIWFLGKCYHHRPEDPDIDKIHPGLNTVRSPAMELFKQDFVSRIWMTYRREFQQLDGSSLTTDCGWGCMLRSGQMLLAQSLIMHFVGRDWTLYQAQSEEVDRLHRLIIQWFGDQMSDMSPFSVHQLVKIGKGSGKRAGDWYGPASVAHIIKEAVDQAPQVNPLLEQVCVYVSQDCTVYKQDVIDLCTRRKSFSLLPILYDVPDSPKSSTQQEQTFQASPRNTPSNTVNPEQIISSKRPTNPILSSTNERDIHLKKSVGNVNDSHLCNKDVKSVKLNPEETSLNKGVISENNYISTGGDKDLTNHQSQGFEPNIQNNVDMNNLNDDMLPSDSAVGIHENGAIENGVVTIDPQSGELTNGVKVESASPLLQSAPADGVSLKDQLRLCPEEGPPTTLSNGAAGSEGRASLQMKQAVEHGAGEESPGKNIDPENHSSSEEVDRWCAVIIMIPVRLGGEEINPIYMRPIQSLFSMPSCVGIIGGKPKHSLYFVGFQDEKLIHLDPHYCQPVVDVTKQKFPVWSFHCMSPRKMSIGKMDPSCTIGFYLRTRDDFERFCAEVPQVVSPPGHNNDYPMFIVRDGRCNEWNIQNSNSNKTERYLRVRHVNQDGKLMVPIRASEDFVLLD